MKDLIIENAATAISEKTGGEFPVRAKIVNNGKGAINLEAFVAGAWRHGDEFLRPETKTMDALFSWNMDGRECLLDAKLSLNPELQEIVNIRSEREMARREQEKHDRLSQMWDY
jgi:hypothetical protein